MFKVWTSPAGDKFIEGFASASEDCGIIAQKKKMGLGKWKEIQ